jgi:hypothetical protein
LRLGTANTPSDWDHPIYWSRPSDPVYRLHCSQRGWGRCEVEGKRVRVPASARPAGGGDHHLAVVDQARGWEYDLWQVQRKSHQGGLLVARWGGRTRFGPGSTGLGAGATAAEYGLLAGIVRAPELVAGRIDHALVIFVACDNGRIVYPAEGRGAMCPQPAAAPPEGARFQLAMSDAEIDALPVQPWARPILSAMAHFGFFVGDTGGSPWTVMLESGSTYTSFGRPDPWVHLAQLIGAVRGSDGIYNLNLADGVDWAGRLRMIDPCVTRGTCPAMAAGPKAKRPVSPQ